MNSDTPCSLRLVEVRTRCGGADTFHVASTEPTHRSGRSRGEVRLIVGLSSRLVPSSPPERRAANGRRFFPASGRSGDEQTLQQTYSPERKCKLRSKI